MVKIPSKNSEFHRFNAQDLNDGFFDVTFKINGQLLYAHRFQLSVRSKAFEQMFLQRGTDLQLFEIEYDNFDVFKEFIAYFYHHSYVFNPNYVFEIISLAEKYEVHQLIGLLDLRLSKMNFENEDIFKLLEVLSIPGFQKLEKTLGKYVGRNYNSIFKSNDFLNTSKKAITGLLSIKKNDELENALIKEIVSWIEEQGKKLKDDLDEDSYKHYIKSEMIDILPSFKLEVINAYIIERMSKIVQQQDTNATKWTNDVLKDFDENYSYLFFSPENIAEIFNFSKKSVYKAILDGEYTLTRANPQSFTLPTSLMSYITQNWSAKAYQKLAQTCKYFFDTYRFVVVEDMNFDIDSYSYKFKPGWTFPDKYMITQHRGISLDLSVKKLWISGTSGVFVLNPHLLMLVSASDVTEFSVHRIHNDEDYLLEYFTKISFNLTKLSVCCDIYSGKDPLTLGDILSYTPKLVSYLGCLNRYDQSPQILSDICQSNTSKLPKLPNLKSFSLLSIGTLINPNAMLQFIKQNHSSKFNLLFVNRTSYDAFKNDLMNEYPDWGEETLLECKSEIDFYNEANSSKIKILLRESTSLF